MIGGAEVARAGVAICGAGVSCGGAEVGMRGTVVSILAGPVMVFWSCCWWTTRVVKAPLRAAALVTMTSRYFFDCVQ
jgi:hypothetical protein